MSAEGMASRFRDVSEYVGTIDKLLFDETKECAQQASRLISINGPHCSLPYLHIEGYGSRKNRAFLEDEAFDQIVCLHLHVLYHINVGKDYEAAYTVHTQIMQTFNKEVLQKRKEENWFMPIFFRLCSDLGTVAKMVIQFYNLIYYNFSADQLGEKNVEEDMENTSSYYELSANFLMESYRTCVSDVRAELQYSKKVAMLNITNQLFRIYFKINKLNLLKPLIRTIDNCGALYNEFTMADKVTYNYFLGRKAMFDSDLPLAEKSLSYAFRNCPDESIANKRRVLVYLIPVKMFLGHMPSNTLLHKYGMDDFCEVVSAVKEGNLARLDKALIDNEDFFIQSGIYLMLEKLRGITFRTLFKRISTLMNTHMIPLSAFLQIVKFLGIDDVDEDEIECIVANLIAEKKIKGYISHQHQKLVISKKDPFPALSTIAQ